MKLWQKTALLCAAALLCVAAACSALLLASTRSALLDAARDGAAGRQQALAASFCELAGRYLRAAEAAVRIPDEMAGEIEAKRTLYVTNGARLPDPGQICGRAGRAGQGTPLRLCD